MLDGLLDSALGDLVEDDPVDGLVAEAVALAQQFGQMPGNGLAFAVRVSGQHQAIRLFQRPLDRLHVAFVALDDLIVHLEAVLGIDRPLFRHEVAHMPIGRHDLEILTEVLLDGLALGGRFDDDEIAGHGYRSIVGARARIRTRMG